MKKLFSDKYGYKFKVKECDERNLRYRSIYKLRWTIKEIIEYMEEIAFECKQNKHDGLIVIFSCHGDEGETIIDSNGIPISMAMIQKKFDPTVISYFGGIPKVFFADCCRGANTSIPIIVNQRSKSITKEENKRVFAQGSNFAIFFANTEGNKSYEAQDGSGGHFLEGLSQILGNDKYTKKSWFQLVPVINNMVQRVSTNLPQYYSGGITQTPEIRTTCNFDFVFNKRR